MVGEGKTTIGGGPLVIKDVSTLRFGQSPPDLDQGRPSIHETMMGVAYVVSRRATCPRLSTGTVLSSPDGRVLATGYNGAPRYLEHCHEVGCLMEAGHCVRSLHSEVNAVLQASENGTNLRGSTVYCTHRPCVRCAMVLVQVRVAVVHFCGRYDTDEESQVLGFFTEGGVQLWRWSADGRTRV